MSRHKNWFSLQLQTYSALTKTQLEEVFSGKIQLSNSFRVFIGRLYPDFLKDFSKYEKSIKKILKKSVRRRKLNSWRKQILGR